MAGGRSFAEALDTVLDGRMCRQSPRHVVLATAPVAAAEEAAWFVRPLDFPECGRQRDLVAGDLGGGELALPGASADQHRDEDGRDEDHAADPFVHQMAAAAYERNTRTPTRARMTRGLLPIRV